MRQVVDFQLASCYELFFGSSTIKLAYLQTLRFNFHFPLLICMFMCDNEHKTKEKIKKLNHNILRMVHQFYRQVHLTMAT